MEQEKEQATEQELKQRYFLQLAYDGTNYHGWQIQPNSITVQEVINKALSTVLREKIEVVGAGRTDTGVHASFYVLHFNCTNENLEDTNLVFKLNRFLPPDISVTSVYKVPNKAHARFHATHRTYKYFITKRKDPFLKALSYNSWQVPNIDKMNDAAKILFEYDDFSSFEKVGADNKTSLCKMMHAQWEDCGNYLVFTIQADRFLRNMVRAIVGTLLEVGLGKKSSEDFRAIIEAKNRSKASASAQGRALFLTDIGYKEELSRGLIREKNGMSFEFH